MGFVASVLGVASLLMPYFAAVFFVPAAFICGVLALVRKEKRWVAVVGLAFSVLGFIGIFGVSQEITRGLSGGSMPESPFGATAIITKSKYDQIANGMTYQKVVDIIGNPGTEVSRTEIAGMTAATYSWQNSNGSNMILLFQEDRLTSKAQFGLRE
jgi:hypothetical protein